MTILAPAPATSRVSPRRDAELVEKKASAFGPIMKLAFKEENFINTVRTCLASRFMVELVEHCWRTDPAFKLGSEGEQIFKLLEENGNFIDRVKASEKDAENSHFLGVFGEHNRERIERLRIILSDATRPDKTRALQQVEPDVTLSEAECDAYIAERPDLQEIRNDIVAEIARMKQANRR